MPYSLVLVLSAALIAVTLASTDTARAQMPPSTMEMAAYSDLHAAVARNDLDAVKRAIAEGAGLAARDRAGRTPLHVAAYQSNEAIFRALMAAGADVNALEDDHYDVITIAAVADDEDILRLALAWGGNPGNVTSPYEGTALIAAAHLGHTGVVDTLIRAGAPLDHVNNLGWTALLEAVILGDGGPNHVETARLLIAAGADASLTDREGVTPLEHAQQRDYAALVDLFRK